MTLVYIPVKKEVEYENYSLEKRGAWNAVSRPINSERPNSTRSHIEQYARHIPPQKSWEFLSDYVNEAQSRYDMMKVKLAEAAQVQKRLEASASVENARNLELKEIEAKRKQEEAKKAVESNIFERAQALAQADTFSTASSDLLKICSDYENDQQAGAKTFRMKLKMTINRRTGQITDSLQQIRAVVNDLTQLCFESRTTSRTAFAYCLNLLASKLLAQAESQVSLHPPSAFALALVAVEVSTSVVEFPSILMALMNKKCCFSVPRYPRKTCNDEMVFKKDLGYNIVDGIVRESDSAFFERMSGLISFYAAIVQTESLSGKPNVLGFKYGWTWLATILNLPPRSITPLLLVSFLEQAAYAFYKKFGVNFEKLIKYILEKYISMVPGSSVAAKIRLELICKEILASGQARIKEPAGHKIAP